MFQRGLKVMRLCAAVNLLDYGIFNFYSSSYVFIKIKNNMILEFFLRKIHTKGFVRQRGEHLAFLRLSLGTSKTLAPGIIIYCLFAIHCGN